MARINVSGNASLKLPAERAEVTVSVTRSGETADRLMQEVVEVHARLRSDAEAFVAGGAATRFVVEAAGLRRRSHWNSTHERELIDFEASASLTVRFADFDAASVWVTRISERGDAQIADIDWSLTSESEASAVQQLRTTAARDALERARTYAAATGFDEVTLDSLTEDGAGPEITPMYAVGGAPGNGGGGAAYLVLVPEWIELEQQVTASFTTSLMGV